VPERSAREYIRPDSRNGVTQEYTETDTVQNGIIIAADVVQTG
jgi:hypothetical protein